MLVQDFLQNCARVRPDKVALVCGGQRFTYGQLDAMANRLANSLREQGLRRGDRVGIYLNNSLEAVVAIPKAPYNIKDAAKDKLKRGR